MLFFFPILFKMFVRYDIDFFSHLLLLKNFEANPDYWSNARSRKWTLRASKPIIWTKRYLTNILFHMYSPYRNAYMVIM